MTCECVNVTHQRRCSKPATTLCQTCGDRLCGGCAKNHHAHSGNFKKLEGRLR